MSPRFLSSGEAREIHARSIDMFGGAHGLRDPGLLESALAMPPASFGGQEMHESVYDKAAAYLFHLVQNHPGVDGNKRIGLAAALVFLRLNGITVDATDDELVDLVLDVARGTADKTRVSAFLLQHTTAET